MSSKDTNELIGELSRVSIVLVSPRVSENVGAAARVMKNFGLRDLRVVVPRDWDDARAERMARGGRDILDDRRVFDTLAQALSDISYVVATSARQGEERACISFDVPRAASLILEKTTVGSVALLFGPEERGLTNRELDVANAIVTIPTNPSFSSLNLAQAVAILCYQLSTATKNTKLHQAQNTETPVPPATLEQIEAMFLDARSFLLDAGFLNPQNPDAVLLHLRRMLARSAPDERDVKVLRGMMRQLRWFARQPKT